ncbi:hypothetical protein [Streptomyces sp. 2A115]|uniref:hypothetical protein n=1 Tax=Streptomyces sp. 2A115 TaxID=3457439 RepID=UPI003FD3863A
MISTRRIVTAVGLAVGATGLVVPSASAAAPLPGVGNLDPIAQLDALAVSGIPAERRDEVPTISSRLDGLNRLNELRQLHRVTDLVAPVTGLVSPVE